MSPPHAGNSLSLSPGGYAASIEAGLGGTRGFSGSEVIRQSVLLGTGPQAPGQRSAFQQAILPPLDYAAIRNALATGSDDEVARLQQ
eukprot:scaffold433327_cov31-Prasinocladus_malaysianus.AAC.1